MATQEVRRTRITAVVFGVILGISLISFVYAFVQQAEAKKQTLLTQQIMNEKKEIELQVEAMTRMLESNNTELQKAFDEMRISLKAAQDKLEKCNCK